MNVDKKTFDTNGYQLVSKVFSTDEIAQIRELVHEQYEIDKKKKLD